MALHKFEQNIKDTLETRTIKPSANAWNKLDDKLKYVENKKSNTIYWFIGVAASIVGVLLVVPLFFNNTIENSTPIIVDTETIIKKDVLNPITVVKTEVLEENLKTIETIKNPSTVKNIIKHQSILKSNQGQFANLDIENIQNHKPEKEDLNKMIEVPVIKEKLNNLTLKEQKINDLIVETENLKAQKNTITEADLEALLNKAQNDIALNKLYHGKTITVDANLLLQDVEVELDKSLRSKVFETLKINYENMITAVSQRND